MKKIYKYVLSQYSKLAFQMPKGAKILCVKEQSGEICIWAEVMLNDEGEPEELEYRTFAIYGTGWEMDLDNSKYIGTVFDNIFVWHIYEEIVK